MSKLLPILLFSFLGYSQLSSASVPENHVIGTITSSCFSPALNPRFQVIDDQNVLVEDRFGRIFHLELGMCWDLRWARRISFDRSFVCWGDDLLVMAGNSHVVKDRCWIQNITEETVQTP